MRGYNPTYWKHPTDEIIEFYEENCDAISEMKKLGIDYYVTFGWIIKKDADEK